MANTERLQVLRAVREAKDSVRSARFETSVPAKGRTKLEKLYTILDRLESDLILQELDEGLDALKRTAERIETLSEGIRETTKKLEAIAEMAKKAAQALRVLVDVASRAATGGLI